MQEHSPEAEDNFGPAGTPWRKTSNAWALVEHSGAATSSSQGPDQDRLDELREMVAEQKAQIAAEQKANEVRDSVSRKRAQSASQTTAMTLRNPRRVILSSGTGAPVSTCDAVDNAVVSDSLSSLDRVVLVPRGQASTDDDAMLQGDRRVMLQEPTRSMT